MERILVTGGGGFIGSHLARHLYLQGNFVRVVDTKFANYIQERYYSERLKLDLRNFKNCLTATKGIEKVYNLAGNMGGIGFITAVGAEIMHDNLLINTYMLEASVRNKVKRYFFSSSACIYPTYKQRRTTAKACMHGKQTRSYCYIDDCIRGTIMLMESDFDKSINIGSERLVAIEQLSDMIIEISGKKIAKKYDLKAPQGVRGRSADISLAGRVLGWEPKVSLEEGLTKTYRWIEMKCNEDRKNINAIEQVNCTSCRHQQ